MRIRTSAAAVFGGALFALAAAGANVGAQEAMRYPAYRFGLMAGANISDMTKTTGADTRTGFLGGVTLNARFTRNFSLQPELYYSQKGVKGTFVDEASGENVDVTLKNDYVELPVLAKWTLVPEGTVQPFVLGGPAFAASASCKAEGSSRGVSASIDCDKLASHNTFDMGGLLGGGVAIPVGKNAMTLGARYTFGFNKVFDESKSKNRTWSLMLGFVF